MLKILVFLFSLLWYSPFYGQTFNKSLRDNSSQFIGGVRDMELTTSHLYNQDVPSPSINPIGFKIQLRSRSYAYRVNVDHLSPLAKFNPRWQIEIAYTSPWMVSKWFRIVFKLKSNIYPNYGGTVDESNHFTSTDKVFDLIPEFDLNISPYFFIAFKDKSLFILSFHYAMVPARGHWTNIAPQLTLPPTADLNTYTNNFARIVMNHGTNVQNQQFAYVLLPNATVTEVTQYQSPIIILTNSKNIHAINHTALKIKGIHFFGKGSFEEITAPQELLYLEKEEEGGVIKASISDPNISSRKIFVQITGVASVSHGKDIKSRLSKDTLTITIPSSVEKGGVYEFSYTKLQ